MVAEVDLVSQSKSPLIVEDGTYTTSSVKGHSTQTNWQDLAKLETSTGSWKETKPYISASNNNGATTDVRLLEALDPEHGDADTPSNGIKNGDGWRVVDQRLTASSNALGAGEEWPRRGPGYNVYSHYLLVQAKQGSGQETIDTFLRADRDK